MLKDKILKLKSELNAIILAHYYQDEDIQEVADFVGDSLELSKKALTTNADTIVFCGVKFMAEVACVLNPEKLVIIPDVNAGCSLEKSCPPFAFKAFKEKYPDHIVITYINSSIEVKSMSDIIVTSSNAAKVISSIPKDQSIIFAPDKYLGQYLIRKTGRDMILWQGDCVVHANFSEKELIKLKTQYPHAKVIAHPECPPHLLNHAEYIGSTSQLIRHLIDCEDYIVLTEPGIIHQMKKHAPNSNFYDVPSVSEFGCTLCSKCPYMRLNTLEKLYYCMKYRSPQVNVDKFIAQKALKAIKKMLSI